MSKKMLLILTTVLFTSCLSNDNVIEDDIFATDDSYHTMSLIDFIDLFQTEQRLIYYKVEYFPQNRDLIFEYQFEYNDLGQLEKTHHIASEYDDPLKFVYSQDGIFQGLDIPKLDQEDLVVCRFNNSDESLLEQYWPFNQVRNFDRENLNHILISSFNNPRMKRTEYYQEICLVNNEIYILYNDTNFVHDEMIIHKSIKDIIYNEEKNQIFVTFKESRYNPEYYLEYQLDKSGDILKCLAGNEDEFFSTSFYYYDENDLLIEIETYNTYGELIIQKEFRWENLQSNSRFFWF